MLRWTAFAELTFAEGAHLSYARAAEEAETDAFLDFPEALVIEDHRMSFSLETESGRAVLEGVKRFLHALVANATEGEAFIEVLAPHEERWVRRVAHDTALAGRSAPLSGEVAARLDAVPEAASTVAEPPAAESQVADLGDARETVRTAS